MIKIFILFLSFNICDLEANGQSVKIWSNDLNMIENNQKFFQKACSKDRIIFPNDSLIFLNNNINSNQIVSMIKIIYTFSHVVLSNLDTVF